MNLKREEIEEFKKKFVTSSKNLVIMNAVSSNSLTDVAVNREFISRYNHTFSNEIKSMKITNQKKSGRCWIFAGLNFMRYYVAKELNVEQIELSQSYTMFWDKLEKANYFLESIIQTANEDLKSRLVSWLLWQLVGDGGQWGMFTNLVEKYGIVPKDVMKESFHTSNSHIMNSLLRTKLREDAMILRKAHENGENEDSLRNLKHAMIEDIYRMLTINMGIPPENFDYEYKDKNGKFHRIRHITPIEFYKEYAGVNLNNMVSLINCPTPDKDFLTTYTVQYLGNVVGGKDILYLNVDLQEFKDVTIKAIIDDQPVWFASDVGKMMKRESGILDTDLYNFEGVYDVRFVFNKAQRLDYGDSLMTHAMVLSGVDLMDEKPLKWKVENSWGEDSGEKGYFVMGNKWFDEYVYEVVVDKKYLSDPMKEALKKKPIVLPPWDPMGSVALVR